MDTTVEMAALTSAECRRLLAGGTIGRIGLIVDGYPLVIPVNYALDRDVVCVRTHPASLVAGADHANVSFEVDELHPSDRTGWSVLVRGLAELVTPATMRSWLPAPGPAGQRRGRPVTRKLAADHPAWHLRAADSSTTSEFGWRLGTAAYM